MYELSCNATMFKADIDNARAILGGICWSQGLHTFKRLVYYAGPPQPHQKGLPNLEHVTQIPPPPNNQPSRPHPAWNALSDELTRSSYVLCLAYNVSPEKDFGSEADVDLNTVPGTLQWFDFPDPLKGQPFTQRRKLEIPGQGNLPMVMADNKYEFDKELIEETWSFVKKDEKEIPTKGDFEIAFTRYFKLPETDVEPSTQVVRLPAWSDLAPLDPAENWWVSIRSFAWEEKKPEEVKKAASQILEEKTNFDRFFKFEPVDRKDLDTRVPPPSRTM
ncbi:mediator complex- subunit Med18 [Apiospora rasikravindrae]|uniref:Mediator of RNA polymerase II transcription subunit 18 n=1 Tax=Apiospora rasikravindrae TaxID=990691 RepID=A0ABR1SXE7_9PEZI